MSDKDKVLHATAIEVERYKLKSSKLERQMEMLSKMCKNRIQELEKENERLNNIGETEMAKSALLEHENGKLRETLKELKEILEHLSEAYKAVCKQL